MSNIEKLYYNQYGLNDEWKDTEETKKALDDLEKSLGSDIYQKSEDEIGTLVTEHEKQGFIAGFRYAISLMYDGKGGAKNARKISIL